MWYNKHYEQSAARADGHTMWYRVRSLMPKGSLMKINKSSKPDYELLKQGLEVTNQCCLLRG